MAKKRSPTHVFYVYEDWTRELIPRCFYVGKGGFSRVKTLHRNRHHANIMQKYGIDRRVVFVTSLEHLTLDLEVELIAEHKTFVHDHDYIFGANYTRGGEGVSGAKFTWSDQRRKDASQAQQRSFQNLERQKQHSEATKKQWQDQTRKLEQSDRMKRSNPSQIGCDSDVTRLRKSLGQKRRYENILERQKTSEAVRLGKAK